MDWKNGGQKMGWEIGWETNMVIGQKVGWAIGWQDVRE
jgi:hypothetical protein